MWVKLFLFLLGLTAVTSRHPNFYRKDYTYVEEYDAFYKLHWDINGIDWSSSFLACDDEGAELFYPQSPNEWTVIKALAESARSRPNVSDIFVGIHDKYGIGEFLTIDGRPVSIPIQNLDIVSTDEDRCVIMNLETGILTAIECSAGPTEITPFVCKKVEDVGCPTIDKGYIYSKETRKCYKRNDKARTWSEAMDTCYMEGGILVVPTSELEANVIANNVLYAAERQYFAGCKKSFNIHQFYTVTGHKLQDSGFNNWYQNDQDGEQYECCTITYYNNRLYYNAERCQNQLPFVCEMSIST